MAVIICDVIIGQYGEEDKANFIYLVHGTSFVVLWLSFRL